MLLFSSRLCYEIIYFRLDNGSLSFICIKNMVNTYINSSSLFPEKKLARIDVTLLHVAVSINITDNDFLPMCKTQTSSCVTTSIHGMGSVGVQV